MLPEEYIHEDDVIEETGRVLSHLPIRQTQEQVVKFLKVDCHEAEIPEYLTSILQIVRIKNYEEDKKCITAPKEEIKEEKEIPNYVKAGCEGCHSIDYMLKRLAAFDPDIDALPDAVQNYYNISYADFNANFVNGTDIVPVRLSTNLFFNSIVCKEKYDIYKQGCFDEYTIVGTKQKKLRFSFEKGYVAISYTKAPIDEKTGFPLIPDEENTLTAITYFCAWQTAQYLVWNGKREYAELSEQSRQLYLKYLGQAKSYFKMPKTLDEIQNLLEQSHQLIPDSNKYYGYFGNLARRQKIVD